MTHSIVFALVLSLVVVAGLFRDVAPRFSRRWWGLVLFFFAITASHGFMDAFTDGGLGIAFYAPFSNERYFMPWQPLAVSYFGIQSVFTAYGAHVLFRELVFVVIPVGLVSAVVYLVRLRRNAGTT